MARAARRVVVRRVAVAIVAAEGRAARAGHVRRLAGAAVHAAFVRRREGARRDRDREHDSGERRRQNDSGDWRASLNACSARNWQREISVRAARRLPVTRGFWHRRKIKGKRKRRDPERAAHDGRRQARLSGAPSTEQCRKDFRPRSGRTLVRRSSCLVRRASSLGRRRVSSVRRPSRLIRGEKFLARRASSLVVACAKSLRRGAKSIGRAAN